MGDKRTTYLETATWDRLDQIAQNHKLHPATASNYRLRKGSAAAVIEAIITDYDRVHAAMEKAQRELAAAKAELAKVEAVKAQAARVKAQVAQVQQALHMAFGQVFDGLDTVANISFDPKAAPAPATRSTGLVEQSRLPDPPADQVRRPTYEVPAADPLTEAATSLAVVRNALLFNRHADGSPISPQDRQEYKQEEKRLVDVIARRRLVQKGRFEVKPAAYAKRGVACTQTRIYHLVNFVGFAKEYGEKAV